jgi:phosphonate transport system ATP-binding protein
MPHPPSHQAELLRIADLAVTYPNGVRALKPTTLSVHRGDFVVLLGSSGAGKSTLLRCLNGLVTPSAGLVTVDSVDVLATAASLRTHRCRTGMIFQQHHLIGRLSVLSNVLLGRLGSRSALAALRPWPASEKMRALEAIDRVGLLPRALERADQLSGGQQQRVGVARALVQKPSLLLADEPVASLDPASARHLLTLIRDICKADDLTAIVSLHQLDLAREFADRIIGLRDGQVVHDSSPKELSQDWADTLYRTPSPSSLLPQANPVLANLHPSGVLT